MLSAKALRQLLKGQIGLLGDPTHDVLAKGIKPALTMLAFLDVNMSQRGILLGKTDSRTGADLKTSRSLPTGTPEPTKSTIRRRKSNDKAMSVPPDTLNQEKTLS